MENNKNKGFTLVELLAVIVLLGIVAGISYTSISKSLETEKKNETKLLVSNIKNASSLFYQECKYSSETLGSICVSNTDGTYNTTIGTLVEYGFLTDKDSNVEKIKDCNINITSDNFSITGDCALENVDGEYVWK